jgi:hypothetical protein
MKLFKIKKKLKTVVLGVFSMLFLCFSILFFSYSVSDYGFAQESSLDGESSPEESTESDPSENTE